ncbi:MAG: RNase adapter RapZ [bacterium]
MDTSEKRQTIDFYILTGLSGAGKTFANKCFEDMGFYCVDNLPPQLIPHFAELCSNSKRAIGRVSLVIDIRGGEFFDELFKALDALDNSGYSYKIVFLDASDEALVRRYKETRRMHPLAGGEDRIIDGIHAERQKLKRLKDRADYYFDTTKMNTWALKREMTAAILGDEKASRVSVNIISFGFKYGLPLDADIALDVRFLPNPYYVESLKNLSGENKEVHDYVMSSPVTQEYMRRASDLVLYTLEQSVEEGKSNVVVAIGCTGGHHRSVALAIELCRILTHHGYNVAVKHRDISVVS